jgi:hypothetical protein
VFSDPVPSPWDDLPEGVELLMTCSRRGYADDLMDVALSRAAAAQAYADHVAVLALAEGSVTYADVGRVAGLSRQGARKRYGPSVDALHAEQPSPAPGCWPV